MFWDSGRKLQNPEETYRNMGRRPKPNSSSDMNQGPRSHEAAMLPGVPGTRCALWLNTYYNNNVKVPLAKYQPFRPCIYLKGFQNGNEHLMDLMDFQRMTICHVDNGGILQELEAIKVYFKTMRLLAVLNFCAWLFQSIPRHQWKYGQNITLQLSKWIKSFKWTLKWIHTIKVS